MRASPRGLMVAVALVGLLLAALPVAAHGNYVSADGQVSADGAVRVELVFAVTDAFLVLHADENGTPGDVIGHRIVPDGPIHSGLTVGVNSSYWDERSGNLTVWTVLHYDEDGDSTFDESGDPPLEKPTSGDLVASRFSVRKGSGTVAVLAEREHAQRTNESRVFLRRVRLPEPGYVAVRADEDGSPGRVVGSRHLEAGVHHDVTVGIDEAFYHERPEHFSLWAVAHRSDGDGAFDPEADPAVAVDGSPVMSRFDVERTGNLSTGGGHEHDHGTETAESTESGESHTHENETGEHSHEHGTGGSPTATASPTPTASPVPDTASSTAAPSTGGSSPSATGETTSARTPGFGIAVAVIALAAALLARRRG